jgi:uncharacterized membrane protein
VSPSDRPPLTRLHWGILGFWLLAAVAFLIAILVNSQDSSGWEGLIAFVAVLLFVFALAGMLVSWALARYATSQDLPRALILVLGPPAFVTLLVLIFNWTS